MALTEKQKLFADEYLIELNVTKADKMVYKNCKSDEAAAAAATILLRNVKVIEYIQERMKDREKRTEITQDMVLKELAAIAFTNGSDFSQVVDEPMIQNGQYIMDPDTGKLKTWETVKITPIEAICNKHIEEIY